MKGLRSWVFALAASFAGVALDAGAENPWGISGGADVRGLSPSGGPASVEMRGLFLNLRHGWKDAQGDRIQLSLQVDADHNLSVVRPYQTYLQLKGSLGRWNLRAGHYLLPFGLLQGYDTERLLLQAVEEEALGLRLDTGLEVHGYLGGLDWAVSASRGVADTKTWDRQGYLMTARIGLASDTGSLGLSGLAGQLVQTGGASLIQAKAALDATLDEGPWSLKAELAAGGEDGQAAGHGLLLTDLGLSERLELNLKAARLWRRTLPNRLGTGLTFKPIPSAALRISGEWSTDDGGSWNQLLQLQAYYEFSTLL